MPSKFSKHTLMTSEQIKIIASLLSQSYVSSSQRHKILSLAAKEMGGDFKQMEARINKLESRIYGTNDSSPTSSRLNHTAASNSPANSTKYDNPKETHSFLMSYNQDSVLRHTCHEIGSEELRQINQDIIKTKKYCYTTHRKQITQAWTNLKETRAPKRLKAMIDAYLTGDDKWSSDKIELSWGNQTLMEWCNEHPGVPPNANRALLQTTNTPQLLLPKAFTWGGNPVQSFTDLVLNFKNRLHIRNESSLAALLTTRNNKILQEEKIDVALVPGFGKKIEIFTHVDQLLNGYKTILGYYKEQWKAEHQDKKMPVINVSIKENSDKVFLYIQQQGTVYRKTIHSTVNRPRGSDYMGLIQRNLNGNCDLKVKALFADNNKYEIEIWTPKSNCARNAGKAPYKLIEGDVTPEVTHILEFPKS